MYKNKHNKYNMPIRFFPKYNITYKIVIAYFNLCTIALDIFLFYELIIEHMNIRDILIILAITLPLHLYVTYLDADLVGSIILKRQYVEINYDGIIIKKLSKEIIIKWAEIFEVECHSYRGTDSIRISRKKDIAINKYLRVLGRWLGLFYIEINNSKYKNIDINKFIDTAGSYMKKIHLL
ncbi:hypothetical protein [Clostridium sp. C8-1-8]|uniref:hypothetical protein n=1 Tax=Clostridium sp. C8-1-8 TaxID=2698831 RepID=UPI00136BAD64|nr:hypothetical protein [Clostridium sp. C8-1-8]